MAVLLFFSISGFVLLVSTIYLGVIFFHPNAKAHRALEKAKARKAQT